MKAMQQLLEIMQQLRDPQRGCPWDRQQTYRSLVPYTLEEAYEVADAIEQDELEHLPDELGDLLFQVVFYAQIGREEGRFDFDEVARRISEKLIRRHPHVFADEKIESAESQTQAWERHKQKEREQKAGRQAIGVLQGVSLALPALSRAAKLQRRAARVGFDWPAIDGVVAKVHEELEELKDEIRAEPDRQRLQEELGDLLFACVNLARHLELDAETALRQANTRFEHRFRQMELALQDKGGIERAGSGEMDAAWEEAKQGDKAR